MRNVFAGCFLFIAGFMELALYQLCQKLIDQGAYGLCITVFLVMLIVLFFAWSTVNMFFKE